MRKLARNGKVNIDAADSASAALLSGTTMEPYEIHFSELPSRKFRIYGNNNGRTVIKSTGDQGTMIGVGDYGKDAQILLDNTVEYPRTISFHLFPGSQRPTS